jgi:hypothetical protein
MSKETNSVAIITSLSVLYKHMDDTVTIGESQRERIHREAISCAAFYLNAKEKGPESLEPALTHIKKLNPLKGSVRVQAVILWYSEMFGLTITIKADDSVEISRDKKHSALKDPKAALAEAKEEKNRFYTRAPDEKPLATIGFSEAEAIKLAKGLESGTITMKEVKEYANNLAKMVKKHRKDKTVIDFATKYKEQNPDEKKGVAPTETEAPSATDENGAAVDVELVPLQEASPALLQQQAH